MTVAYCYNRRVNKNKKPQPDEPRDPNVRKIILTNRKARHEYHIIETFEAGMELIGVEVKSIRNGQVHLQESFAKVEHGEVWIYGMHVAPYEHGTRWNVDPIRRRKLLLHRREIASIRSQIEQKGFTLVPLALFLQRGYVKLELAVAKGKQLWDRRSDIQSHDVERERRREVAERD